MRVELIMDGSASCRIYTNSAGEMGGVPPVKAIAAALGTAPRRRSGWRGLLSVVPAVGASLLPVGACPACWPAYAGLLSALGLGVFIVASVWNSWPRKAAKLGSCPACVPGNRAFGTQDA